jgi:hypothetical protein
MPYTFQGKEMYIYVVHYVARFVVLTAVKIQLVVFWVVTPCNVVARYRRFRGLPEDGDSMEF